VAEKQKTLARSLGLFPAIMILVGTVIGSGIFMVPGKVAAAAGSPGPDLAAWIIAGVACTLMALVYAELAPMIPKAGGAYVYIQEAYGEAPAFFYGWTMILGSYIPVMAMLALAFTNYLSFFWPGMTVLGSRIVATILIVLLSLVNVRGVKLGAMVQNVFTVGKLAALGLVIVVGIFTMKFVHFTPFVGGGGWATTTAAAVPAILAFGGYYTLAYMSEEIEHPKRNLPLAMIIGMSIVIVVNILINVVSIGNLPFADLAKSAKPVASVASAIFGPVGGAIVALGALVSIFGSLNSSTMGLPRVAFAMARDGMLFDLFSMVHPKYGTPWVSILLYGLVAIGFVWTGTFMTLLLMGVFVARLLECLVAIALIVLRHKQPSLERPLKMWGYPYSTVFVVLLTGYLVTKVAPAQIRQGVYLALTSIPAYLIFRYLVPHKKETSIGA
jgi:APA family basic amino acid/polyamine antiporter